MPAAAARRLVDGSQLPGLVQRAAETYGLGVSSRFSVINIGYEDCNVDIQAGNGRYVIKVFAADRAAGHPRRTVAIIEEALAAGVTHPRLVARCAGGFLHRDAPTGYEYIVMDFVDGVNFYDLGRPPNLSELRLVVQQAAMIHSIDLSPPPVLDVWAVPNLTSLLGQVANHLDPEDLALAERAARLLRSVDAAELPSALIHGDMTKGNLIRSPAGPIAVLDFSVANRFPRIQELAVVAANLLHGDEAPPLLGRIQLVADLYSEYAPLSGAERRALVPYTVAAAAMELLGAVYERHSRGNDSSETDYVMELGRAGLRAGAAELGFVD